MLRRKKQEDDTWSPYGHEAARKQLLATRRMQVILAALAIALLYGLFLQLTLTEDTQPQKSGQTIEKEENEPVRVTVSPGGRPAFMNPQTQAPDGNAPPQPTYEPQSELIGMIQPFLTLLAPLLAALWLVGKAGGSARGKYAELNLGVYKGAMPYEMHTARAYKQVYTHRKVDAHVFGRGREDFVFGTYLQPPSPAVRRLLGDPIVDDKAGVTRLRAGGSRKGPSQATRLQRATTGMGAWVGTKTAAATEAAKARAEELQRQRRQQAKIRALKKRKRAHRGRQGTGPTDNESNGHDGPRPSESSYTHPGT